MKALKNNDYGLTLKGYFAPSQSAGHSTMFCCQSQELYLFYKPLILPDQYQIRLGKSQIDRRVPTLQKLLIYRNI
ncbi:MAG: hypothetical protein JKY98_02245 [Gammaproteobacteria bacterium]|nr:hypothetical protein [Gammaproteobacteria bacterium]